MPPLYDYKCPLCEHVKEYMHKYDNKVDTLCEECGEAVPEMVISGTDHFVFKGDGTYDKGVVKHGKGDANYRGGLIKK